MAADLYNEIGRLKSENELLSRTASKVPKLEQDLAAALSDVKLFKAESDKVTALKGQLEAQLVQERSSMKKLSAGMDVARKTQVDAEKMVKRLQSDLKFDKMAREGQVKKSRIIEHELTEYKHENFLQTKLRSEAEYRAKTTNVALQKERSMRLADIHSRNKVIIAKQVSERNEKIAEMERFKEAAKAKQLESEVGGLKAAVKSQTQIIGLNDVELHHSLAEVQEIRMECINLKKSLLKSEEDVLHHVESRRDLEQEVHRLGTELMMQSTTASERTRPLSTAAKGDGGMSLGEERARAGMTRPETTSAARIRRRTAVIKSREASRAFSRAFTSTGGRRDESGVTLDEAFIIPIHTRKDDVKGGRMVGQSLISVEGVVDGGLGQTSPDGRAMTANGNVTWGESRGSLVSQGGTVLSPLQRMPSALKKSRKGSATSDRNQGMSTESEIFGVESVELACATGNMNGVMMMAGTRSLEEMGSGGGSSGERGEETPIRLGNAEKKKKPKLKRGKSLNIPGSLFLGSGLGLKKSVMS